MLDLYVFLLSTVECLEARGMEAHVDFDRPAVVCQSRRYDAEMLHDDVHIVGVGMYATNCGYADEAARDIIAVMYSSLEVLG